MPAIRLILRRSWARLSLQALSKAAPSRKANKWRMNCLDKVMETAELRKNGMMAHLLDSLESGRDIGHYGRLVVAMVAQNFMSADDLIKLLAKDRDCDPEKARALVEQVKARGYNPPKRERILEWMQKQEFPICPHPEDANACNVYGDIDFPKDVYEKIKSYYGAASHNS